MIRFSKDWKKMDALVFTTIRKNTGSKSVGQIHTIKTPTKKFMAKIIGLWVMKKKDITEEFARYDAEMSREDMIALLGKWYGKSFDDFVTIVLIKH